VYSVASTMPASVANGVYLLAANFQTLNINTIDTSLAGTTETVSIVVT
jgi:hypothetical protein